MNLITCAEDCEYQEDGYCRLESGAPVNSVRVGGCSYYQRRKSPLPWGKTEEKNSLEQH